MPDTQSQIEAAMSQAGLEVVGLIQSIGQSSRIKRLETFLKDLDQRLRQLERDCDEEVVGDLLNRHAWSLAERYTEEKAAIFAAVLAGTYEGTLPDAYADSITTIMNELDPVHFAALKAVRDLPADDHGKLGKDTSPMVKFSTVLSYLDHEGIFEKGQPRDLLVAWTTRLVGHGLLRTRLSEEKSGGFLLGINFYGLMTIQSFRLSDLGTMLVELLDPR